jgi:D-3-phosphoglycerate dehydrogenase
MNFLVLENKDEINLKYLSYLKDLWHSVFEFQSNIDLSLVEAIIIRSKLTVNSELLDSYPKLKYICRVWVGLDKIDLLECSMRGIKVINTPWANSSSVADLVVWGILSLLRKTSKKWNSLDDRFQFFGENLENKKIWFIGFGNIAKKVQTRISWFENNEFFFYDPYIDSDIWEIKKISDKNEILSNSDIISFHIPLTPETKNFLWKEEFLILKKNVKIINTSRWWIIDEKELIKFLSINKNAWAFLDTWGEEPENPKQELKELENCIITPHIGAMTEESNKNMHIFKEFLK